MDTIREYALDAQSGEQFIEVPVGSTILTVSEAPMMINTVLVGVLVDVDSEVMEEKTIIMYEPDDDIAENMKAKFIGIAIMKTALAGINIHRNVYYAFEKLG